MPAKQTDSMRGKHDEQKKEERTTTTTTGAKNRLKRERKGRNRWSLFSSIFISPPVILDPPLRYLRCIAEPLCDLLTAFVIFL